MLKVRLTMLLLKESIIQVSCSLLGYPMVSCGNKMDRLKSACNKSISRYNITTFAHNEMKSKHIITASADNILYNVNTITFLHIIKLYANDIIERIHIKIGFSSKVTMNGHGKNHMHST